MKNKKRALCVAAVTLLFSAAQVQFVSAHGNEKHQPAQAGFIGLDSPAAKVVKQFHQSLKAADEAGIRQALARDVLIYEGGSVERSLEDYAGHHMKADMAYLRELTLTLKEHQVRIMGDTAISTSVTHAAGEYKGKKIDAVSMETLILARQTDGSWKIVHIHWS
jgi:ketosteroid isomerase-like protein